MSRTPKIHLFSSESVSSGHSDKLADQISDHILDAVLRKDPNARVACEVLLKSDLVVLAGEITTFAKIDYEAIARQTIIGVGYNHPSIGLDGHSCKVITAIEEQSPDIAQGINVGEGLYTDLGAGDQGLMFGFACDETPNYMPAPIYYAHRLLENLQKHREHGQVPWLRPDAKSQVTVSYRDDHLDHIPCIVLSTQHNDEVTHEEISEYVIEGVIKKTIPLEYLSHTQYLINPTGKFIVGGPASDTGLTGRKIVVDTYGGRGGHGGGAFSGKDPTKVDRSAAYMVRYIAKNIVASGLARRCLIQVAYAIGFPHPVSLWVDDYGTGIYDSYRLTEIVRETFSLKPIDIINHLGLRAPIYSDTAVYGHFGRAQFPWEKTDSLDILKQIK